MKYYKNCVIIAILLILVSVVLAVYSGIIFYVAMILLGYFVMIPFCLEAGHRDAEKRKELEKEMIERLRKQLEEGVRKELEAKK